MRPLTTSRMIDGSLAAAAFAGRDQRFDKHPFLVGQIAWITQLAAVVAAAIFCRPHRRSPQNQIAFLKSQPINAFKYSPDRLLELLPDFKNSN